jgi:uncharacterized DUF497 family protein/uncharacterized protein (DUF4415 family)
MYVQWSLDFEWDPEKAKTNVRTHGVRFEESKTVFDDPCAITIADDEADAFEQRFVSLGMGALGRILIVVYTYLGRQHPDNFGPAGCGARARGIRGGTTMKDSYDFSKGRRGRITKPAPESGAKVKITIRLDQDIVDHFLARADETGGAVGYQTLINDALRRSLDAPSLEAMVRRVIREELKERLDAA